MDIATIVGLVGCSGVILMAMMSGGGLGPFIDIASILIVVGGTSMAVLTKFPLNQFLGALPAGMKAFLFKPESAVALITEAVEMATIARRQGVLALEGREVSNSFLQKGVQLLADGQAPEFVQKMLMREIDLTIARHEGAQAVFRSVGDSAPAMGMIGTLIGLVQMLGNMSDPKAIGPAMAIALLTTLYGSLIANVFAIPLADKLAIRTEEERLNRQLILESIVAIQQGLNPKVMEELLKTYLPPALRAKVGADKAAA